MQATVTPKLQSDKQAALSLETKAAEQELEGEQRRGPGMRSPN